MRQIAELSGVSQPTVSFVLNAKDGMMKISPQTRAKVLAAAERLGYRRNGAAKAMATGRFGCVALLRSSHHCHSYLPDGLLDSIHDSLSAQGLSLLLGRLADDRLADESFVPKILSEWTSDGLLIDYINDIPKRLIDIVHRHRIPSIWINSKQDCNCVFPDDYRAGYDATRKLIELGHRRIGYAIYIPGYVTKNRHYSEIDRRDGYVRAMVDAGLKPMIFGDGQTIPRDQAVSYSQGWLSKKDRPTAVLMYGSREPVAIFLAARLLGLEIPKDISLVVLGAPEPVDVGGVTLSTMVLPQQRLGQIAVEQLQKRITAPDDSVGPQSVEQIWVPGSTVAVAPPDA